MSADRWNARPPRFVFNAEEPSFMRFAPAEAGRQPLTVEALDLSRSGLSFQMGAPADRAAAPDEGDMIKIEFAPPGLDPIACFATVVRVDQVGEWHPEHGDVVRTKVAVRFRNLPRALERELRRALDPLVGAVEADSSFAPARITRALALEIALAAVGLVVAVVAFSAPYSAWVNAIAAWSR